MHVFKTLGVMGLAVAVLAGCEVSPEARMEKHYRNPITAEFDQALDRDPTPKTLYAMARILIARSEDRKARYVLNRIIETDPQFIPAYCELGESLMREDRVEEATNVLISGLAHAPDDPILHNNLGMVSMISGAPSAAADRFARAVTGAPNNARFRSNLAAALAMTGAYDRAMAEYVTVMPVIDAHHNIGVIAESRGDIDRAQLEFEIVRQLEAEQKADRSARRPWKLQH